MAQAVSLVQSLAGAEFGGAENFYTRLVCAIAEVEDIRQTACTRDNPRRVQELQVAGVPVELFRFGGRFDVLDHYRYRRALKRLSPDVVLTYMNRASVLTPRGSYKLMCRLGHYYDLKYYRHADYWIGNTQGICDYIVRGGMPAERVLHIPNFVDEAPVQAARREDLGAPGDAPLLLAAGRLHRNKAFDVLLRALPQVPDATLWLAGEGPERNALQSLVGELGLAGRVRFLGWRDDVGALMQAADAFVCPSRHEGLGGIVLEAWYHQCPIVATASQGPAELIEDGATGRLVPVDAVDELAGAINAVLSSPDQAVAMANRARARYDAHYARSVIVQRYAEVIRQVAA